MGWQKFIVEDTLSENFSKDFLKSLLAVKDEIQFHPWDESATEEEVLEKVERFNQAKPHDWYRLFERVMAE